MHSRHSAVRQSQFSPTLAIVGMSETEAKILAFMQTGLGTYKANDCVNFKARLLAARRIGPRFALIDIAGTWKVSMITRYDPQIMSGVDSD